MAEKARELERVCMCVRQTGREREKEREGERKEERESKRARERESDRARERERAKERERERVCVCMREKGWGEGERDIVGHDKQGTKSPTKETIFCKRALLKRLYSAKETYNFKEPTNRSQPISIIIIRNAHTHKQARHT